MMMIIKIINNDDDEDDDEHDYLSGMSDTQMAEVQLR